MVFIRISVFDYQRLFIQKSCCQQQKNPGSPVRLAQVIVDAAFRHSLLASILL